MKLKKLITMGLAAMMAVSAMSISAFAEDTDKVMDVSCENVDTLVLDDAEYAIFIIENDEVKQITPVQAEDNCSLAVSADEIQIISSEGEVLDEVDIIADVENIENVYYSLGTKYYVKNSGTKLLRAPMAGADVILTLEAGTAFWKDSNSGAYYYGCVKTGTSTYTYGYVLSTLLEVA